MKSRTEKLIDRIAELTGKELFRCYQCQKCSSGCPVSDVMDLLPAEIIRLIQLGFDDEIFQSKTIWICASCETCTTRCPNEIDIAKIMDVLREECIKLGYIPAEKDVLHFHTAFLSSVKSFGRVYEPELIGKYKLKSKRFFDDSITLKLGFNMLRKGKIKFFPHRIKGIKDLRNLFSHFSLNKKNTKRGKSSEG